MAKTGMLLIALFSCLTSLPQSTSYDLVVCNISVIDVQHSKVLPGQTIYIQGGRVAKIERSKATRKIVSDTIIDGTGKFILPGFWDMHIHICWKDNLDGLFTTLLN